MDPEVFAVVTGLAASLTWAFSTWVVRELRRWRDYGHLEGVYGVYPKFSQSPTPVFKVRVLVLGNVLHVTSEGMAGGDEASGQIVMSDASRISGEGRYHHLDSDRWGFWELVVQETTGTLLIHSHYIDKNSVVHHQAYKWRKIEGPGWWQVGFNRIRDWLLPANARMAKAPKRVNGP